MKKEATHSYEYIMNAWFDLHHDLTLHNGHRHGVESKRYAEMVLRLPCANDTSGSLLKVDGWAFWFLVCLEDLWTQNLKAK